MRLLPITILVSLSACASAPSSNHASILEASWQGAPADELIAMLGEPITSKKGNMTWQFLVPVVPKEMQASSHSKNRSVRSTGSLSVLSGCGGCSPDGSVVAPGPTYTWVGGSSGSSSEFTERRRFCRYLALVENGIVSKLITLDNSRAGCLFTELPLRSTD